MDKDFYSQLKLISSVAINNTDQAKDMICELANKIRTEREEKVKQKDLADKNLQTKGLEAATKLFERTGITLKDCLWACDEGIIDLVGIEDNTLICVDVRTMRDINFDDNPMTDKERKHLERLAMEYAKTHPECINMRVRFDRIEINVIQNDRALMRHSTNILGTPVYDEE